MLNNLLSSCWLSFYLCFVFSSALESSKIRPSKTLQVDIFVLHITGNMYTLCNFNFLSNPITYKKIEALLTTVLHKHEL